MPGLHSKDLINTVEVFSYLHSVDLYFSSTKLLKVRTMVIRKPGDMTSTEIFRALNEGDYVYDAVEENLRRLMLDEKPDAMLPTRACDGDLLSESALAETQVVGCVSNIVAKCCD
ncbi:hypothetical protein TELCIR_06207 [Teladorsagia circumcincta]|uniref:Uncharacterized protein n=1 Tax=Teladorsagia circumcincta TaxID=45464 RepID=A0A2G9UNU0_TELCI|nr:hypothetical protein TELCIR_06207 [Teladorsagia circumcincta]